MKKINPLARQIALAGFEIGAIELRPKNPFPWASGTYNPPYNDNRMLLGTYAHRMLVADGLDHILKENGRPEIICATSLSGIGPAASLAARHNLDLVILHEGKLTFCCDYPLDAMEVESGVDLIISTTPWAIKCGVELANKHKLPFAYIRPEKKDHGKKRRIEGIVKPGQKALLLRTENDHFSDIYTLLLDEGILIRDRMLIRSEELKGHYPKVNNWPAGKSVVVIEDLVSTGGSALKEVNACRDADANVLYVGSIFDYGLESAKRHFEEAKCPLYSILDYDGMLEVAKEQKMFSDEEFRILADWRVNPENWGEKNGFPRVVKEKEQQV